MTTAVNSHEIIRDILALVAKKMQVDATTLAADTDLFAAGLDSIALMGVVAHWRAMGHPVDFASLARDPRADAWASYLALPLMQQTQDSSISSTLKNDAPLRRSVRQDEPFALAPMQYAYWLGRDPKQPFGGVSAHLYTEFQFTNSRVTANNLEPQRLSKALDILVARHPSLRLKVTGDGKQVHLPISHNVPLVLNDLRALTAAKADEQLNAIRQTYSAQMLNIEAGEVLAIALSLMPDGSHRLHLDVDMISADAVSYRTLLRELALLYEDINAKLPSLTSTYRDFRIASEASWPSIKETDGQWWQNRLEQLPEGPQLPLKESLSATPQTSRRHFHFDANLRQQLYRQCLQRGLTPAAVLATVLAETLAGWSREPRFLLNVPLFLRPMGEQDFSGVVGDFSSSLMLDVDMSGNQAFAERAKQVQRRLHEDVTHAGYNGVQVLRDLGRLKGRQVTAPVVFTSALNLGELFDTAVRRVFGDPIWVISQGPQVLLDTQITELDDGLLLNWDCREDAFVDGVLDAMFAFFRESVESLATAPEAWSECLAKRLPVERTRPQISCNAPSLHEKPSAPPETPLERAVAAVWRGVIGGDGSNAHQNLFAAGGDSVLANTLVAQLREIFGVPAIDMQRLFNAPTIAGLAEAIGNAGDLERATQIATVYCEIMELDDDALLAELERVEVEGAAS
jgi:mycobactin phenyloxazoline synthetase